MAVETELVSGEITVAPLQPIAVSIRVAADLISVSERTMTSLVSSGEISASKVGSRRLVPVAELRRWIEAKAAEQQAARVQP